MEEILKILIFSSVILQNIVLLWFVIMLNVSLPKIKEEYKTVSEEDKEKLISQGLSTSTVMKAFVLPCALKKYLWYDYALKEKKA